MTHAIKRAEAWVHYSVALVLIGIAVVTLAKTTWTLITASGPLASATSNAVGGVLLVLIIIEITRTVVSSPGSNRDAICRLLAIAIVSTLREVLWAGMHTSSAGITVGEAMSKSLGLCLSMAAVIGLVLAFVLVRRAVGKE